MAEVSGNWRPKAIIFDLLTALLDSWHTWDNSTPTKSSADGRRWRARYLELTFGAGAYTAATSYERLVRQAAADVGLPSSAPDALLQGWSGLQAWPETDEVLRELAKEGYKLGVVTNCSRELGRVAVGIVERSVGDGFSFDATVTAEESGFYKPVGAAYEAILVKMGLSAEEVLFVAGSAGDVQGATDVGMKVVWHNHVGLAKKGSAVPLREGKSLRDALGDFVQK